MDIKVSVIMPVLNGMPYFKTALESVMGQTLKEIEIIIVDGGSTDGTIEYIKERQKNDNRLILLHSDKKSMGYQYNLGIERACGDYLSFCESDDIMDSGMLESLYRSSISYPEAEYIKKDYHGFQSEGELSVKVWMLSSARRSLRDTYISLIDAPELIFRDVNMWNGIYSRTFIENNNIRLNETPGAAFQDTGFILQVHLYGEKAVYLSDDTNTYRYRKDNEASSTYKDTSLFVMQEHIYIMDKLLEQDEIKNTFGTLVIERLFPFFCDRYGKSISLNLDENNRETFERYRSRFKEYYDSLTIAQKIRVDTIYRVRAFFEDTGLFRSICRYEYECRIGNIRSCIEKIFGNDRVVVFSAGELGQAFGMLLRSLGYKKTMLMSDNNEGVQGKKVAGIDVVSVKEAVNSELSTVYIIPNDSLYFPACRQLMGYGIKRDEIVVFPFVDPHNALELRWELTEQ